MRINHAGEVCAQALYLGQAAVARRSAVREQLLEAAGEEADHLAWCAKRLDELGSTPSALNLFWFAGSFAIGAGAGIVGDALSLGFIVETERQVEAHLGEHLEKLPDPDARSRVVVKQMQEDEARHGANAKDAGARELPPPIPRVMAAAASVMKWLAYRIEKRKTPRNAGFFFASAIAAEAAPTAQFKLRPWNSSSISRLSCVSMRCRSLNDRSSACASNRYVSRSKSFTCIFVWKMFS